MADTVSQLSDREPRPSFWVKLLRPVFTIPVTLLAIILAGLVSYRESRFRGIPVIDEVVDRETEGRIEIKDEENAFTYYGRAWKQLPETLDDKALGDAVDALEAGGDWSDVTPAARADLASCELPLDEWKRGSECERGVRLQSAGAEWFDFIGVQESRAISRLVVLKSAMLRHEGNSEQAWEWLRALFCFSRHLGNPGPGIDRSVGVAFHAMCRESIVHWADDDVTVTQLETAIREVRFIDRRTALNSAVLKHGYMTSARLLSQPKSLEEYYLTVEIVPEDLESVSDFYLFLNAEPQLAELLLRHVYANYLSQCDRPRRNREFAGTRYPLFKPTGAEKSSLMNVNALDDALTRSRMAQWLGPNIHSLLGMTDREQVNQVALELCLTAELFRRKREKYPENLEDLVPDFIDEIPRDLYGRAPNERMLMARQEPDDSESDSERKDFYSGPGLVIYCRGENGIDDGGELRRADIGLKIPVDPGHD
ncbi:MAG: hypothetical protein ACKVHE_30490 [Planctomycetales bacterium]|jgi:hypothetical protein